MSVTVDRLAAVGASSALGGAPLSIAMLAPPWIAIPPLGYGGVEAVVADLTEALVRRGHHVTLYCAPGSRSSAETVPILLDAHPDEIERSLYESDHVARAFHLIDRARHRGRPFDIVHDHCGFTALAMADRLHTPLLHTLHGPFTTATARFYAHHAGKASIVAISNAQIATGPADIATVATIPNPIALDEWPFVAAPGGYLFWIGRFAEEKGPHLAIDVARKAGLDLVLAGVVQPGQREFFERRVKPHIDGVHVRFVGEVGGQRKKDLFAGARALLMPIRWPEPFGMVMIEALASGTPVVAFDEGAVRELVEPGVTGFIVADEEAMVEAIGRLDGIDRRTCRGWVRDHCDVSVIAAAYEDVYRSVLRDRATVTPRAA